MVLSGYKPPLCLPKDTRPEKVARYIEAVLLPAYRDTGDEWADRTVVRGEVRRDLRELVALLRGKE